MRRAWKWPEDNGGSAAAALTARFAMPRALAETMARRGYADDEATEHFLNPRLDGLADPLILADMEKAAARVWRAVDDGETVFVHGDYDVDGITGTAFIARTLKVTGVNVIPYVPSREHGYGLGPVGIQAAVDAGAKILMTVDNGIRSFDEVDAARNAGLDVIILDHHQPGEGLPRAYAVVNPQRGEQGEAFKNLAAVGVAAKFMHAMALARPHPELRAAYREALQLVALGTIADVVPLYGENRIFVSHGLRELAASKWAGIKALKAVARMTQKTLTATDVAFFIAPRINAAGRMGEASDALALLLADDPSEAYALAEKIEGMNRDRRTVEARVTGEAVDAFRVEAETPSALVMWSDDWPVGVVGIAANRLLDRFHRPAFMIAMDGDRGRGSARSRKAFPLPNALLACDSLLEEHGGHPEAAGFSIRRECLEAFRDRMVALAGDSNWDEEPEPWEVDAAVTLDEISPEFVRWLERLSPFGRGNPEPLFGCEKMTLSGDPSVVGKKHLRLSFQAGGRELRAIAFNQGNRLKELIRGQRVDALFNAVFDTYRGGNNLQLVVRDLRTR